MSTNRASALWSVPSIVAHRVRMLCMMVLNPTPRRRREATRMVTEKIEAACEGALAIQLETLKQAQSLCLDAWNAGLAGRLARAGRRIVQAGRAPANRRIRANGRRLGGRKAP